MTRSVAKKFLRGEIESLNNFIFLEDPTAPILGTHDGDLIMDGVTSISDAAASALARHTTFHSEEASQAFAKRPNRYHPFSGSDENSTNPLCIALGTGDIPKAIELRDEGSRIMEELRDSGIVEQVTMIPGMDECGLRPQRKYSNPSGMLSVWALTVRSPGAGCRILPDARSGPANLGSCPCSRHTNDQNRYSARTALCSHQAHFSP